MLDKSRAFFAELTLYALFIRIVTFANSTKQMTEKLEDIRLRFEEVGQLLAQPETVKDLKKFSQLSKEYRDLEKIVVKYNALREARKHLQQAKEVLDKEKDPEMREFAKSEIDELEVLTRASASRVLVSDRERRGSIP